MSLSKEEVISRTKKLSAFISKTNTTVMERTNWNTDAAMKQFYAFSGDALNHLQSSPFTIANPNINAPKLVIPPSEVQSPSFHSDRRQKKDEYESYAAGLEYRVSSKPSYLQKLLIDGYIKENISYMIPMDIVNLCQTFYSQVIHWKIDCEPINANKQTATQPVANDKNTVNNPQFDSDEYRIDGLRIKWHFEPIFSVYDGVQTNSFLYLHALLPANINHISYYLNVFCADNKAEIKKYQQLSHGVKTYYGGHHHGQNKPDNTEWIVEKFSLIGAYPTKSIENVKNMQINFYMDILEIVFTQNTDENNMSVPVLANYFKTVFMKRKISYKWELNKALLHKIKYAVEGTEFWSDSFDGSNNNWSLCIKAEYARWNNYGSGNRRNGSLWLYLFNLSAKIKRLMIYCTVTKNFGASDILVDSQRNLFFDHYENKSCSFTAYQDFGVSLLLPPFVKLQAWKFGIIISQIHI